MVKRNHVSSMTSSDSGGQQANSDVLSHDQVTVDNHVFQARLQDLVSKERDRLLGIPSSMPVDDIWSVPLSRTLAHVYYIVWHSF